MSDPAAAAASPSAKKSKAKPVQKGPAYLVMIVEAIAALKESKGSSREAIKKYIKANNKVGDNADRFINKALKNGVDSGALIHPKNKKGSYKLVDKPKPRVKQVKKSKNPKKSSAPKKAKKPVAAKKPSKKKAVKKGKKPKKPVSKPVSKPVAKKPAAKKARKAPKKKPAAKKVAKK